MNLKVAILMLFAVLGVLLTIVALGGNLSSEWTTVGQEVAPAIVLIALVGVVLVLALGRR